MSARILDAPTVDEIWPTLRPGDSRTTRLALVHVGPFTASITRTDYCTDAGDYRSSGLQITVDNDSFGEDFLDHDLGAKPDQVADLEHLMVDVMAAYRQLDPEALK
ncbi:hypothetical protein CH298_02755 [Rhodococcoides fascians]|uniref:hypothetical protein n=1 Tax=Rhodococcoides fascians TaxID=1828 RepID=UPI000B9C255F|nr:hypothetical protein [Rhodococcus fascians]OZE92472.1 hypothetical protein CH303_02755 [Rhodococcus fascians]OZF23105.1 hypothetical protein CH298_02755 [Rhodococcus fascians]OZF24819.1 hypothetical protein CH297_02755 [Rhodococcus fascians]OZF72414.1 hypothetical protein CH308_02760 [Rhodococcus fascians]OZF73712.1 hypothetical protein CH307_02755 [Rhodococcus fascians]